MVNYMRWVCHWRGLGTHMNPGEDLPKTQHKLDLLTYEFLHERNMLFGTVDYIIDKIEEMQNELNLQNLKVWSNFPGVKHADCMKSIKLFTEKIIKKVFNGKKLTDIFREIENYKNLNILKALSYSVLRNYDECFFYYSQLVKKKNKSLKYNRS